MKLLTAPISSKQVATFVLLILMSMALSFIEVSVFPDLTWLKYDPSGIVAALAALLYGPWHGVAVALLSWLPHASISPMGAAMNIFASASLALALGGICRRDTSVVNIIAGSVTGTLLATAVSICLNFVVTPLYTSASYEYVVSLVVPYLLPFNLGKAAFNAIVAALFYRTLHHLLNEPSEDASTQDQLIPASRNQCEDIALPDCTTRNRAKS